MNGEGVPIVRLQLAEVERQKAGGCEPPAFACERSVKSRARTPFICDFRCIL